MLKFEEALIVDFGVVCGFGLHTQIDGVHVDLVRGWRRGEDLLLLRRLVKVRRGRLTHEQIDTVFLVFRPVVALRLHGVLLLEHAHDVTLCVLVVLGGSDCLHEGIGLLDLRLPVGSLSALLSVEKTVPQLAFREDLRQFVGVFDDARKF